MINYFKKTNNEGYYVHLFESTGAIVKIEKITKFNRLTVKHFDLIDDVYNELLLNFNTKLNNLPVEEKKRLILALKVYGTAISLPLNKLDAIPNYDKKTNVELWNILMTDSDFKEVVPRQIEYLRQGAGLLEIEREILKAINVSNNSAFIDSLKRVLLIINKYKDYFILPRDLLVFRGIATKPNFRDDLSQGDIISTSLSYNIADQPTNRPEYGYVNWINVMLVEAGTPYMVGTAPLSNKQKEVILFKNNLSLKKTKFLRVVTDIDGKYSGIARNIKIFTICSKNQLNINRTK